MDWGDEEELTKAKAAIQGFKEALGQGKISGARLGRALKGATPLSKTAAAEAQENPVSMDLPSESIRSGRKRPLWTVPAAEIQERREGWLALLEGKTTAEIQSTNGFSALTVHLTEVWLWAIAYPALSITCTEEGGRWGFNYAVDAVPRHLQAEVARWRSGVAGRSARCARPLISSQVPEDFGHVVFDELGSLPLTDEELAATIGHALDVKGVPAQSPARLMWGQLLTRIANFSASDAPLVIGNYRQDPLGQPARQPASSTDAPDHGDTAAPADTPNT